MLRILLALFLLAPAGGQGTDVEGPLRNDTYLPTSQGAQEALAQGDRAWRRALDGGAAAPGERTAAFDAWQGALADSAVGDVVRLADPVADAQALFPDGDATHGRRVEGVAAAVLRRLESLSPADLVAWTGRFDPLAEAALATAPYRRAHLERIERNWPLTRAAALAGLRCADLCLEEGRPAGARTWVQRARRHLAAGEPGRGIDRALDQALARRTHLLNEILPKLAPEAWRGATRLHLVRGLRLESDRHLGRDPRPAPLGRGLRPGLTHLEDGGLAVQTPQGLVWVNGATVRGEPGHLVNRQSLADLLDLPPLRPYASPSAGGWPLSPAGDGRHVVVVIDRGHTGRVVREFQLPARSNHLVCMRAGESGRTDLVWHLSDDGLERVDGTVIPLAQAVGLEGHLEFQPGPVVHEGILFVQARVLDDPTAEGQARGGGLVLLALDVATGALRFTRDLTRAADLRRDLGGRNGSRGDVPTSGMPLAIVDGLLVIGTNVGLVCAFDAVDGRWAWGVRTRRRDPEAEGWPGSRAPMPLELRGGRAILVAPFDSDRLYALPPGLALGERFFVQAPQPLGSMLDLVGGSGEELLFLGRDGRHQALCTRRPGQDMVSALYLGRGEGFGGAAVASPERVILSSDRAVQLFDRTQGNLLISVVDLPDLGAGRGGNVTVRGDRVFVLGRDTLWLLSAE
jgi:hypothetical protein